VGIIITPFIAGLLYKYKLWKQVARKDDVDMPKDEEISAAFKGIHNMQDEVRTPRPGGLVVWVSVVITMFLVFLMSYFFPNQITTKLNFLSRSQTLLPFFTLLAGGLIGFSDDMCSIFAKAPSFRNGFPRWLMILIVSIVGLVSGIWFFSKLGVTAIHIPFVGQWELGILIIPLFLLVFLGTFSSGVIDGVDGLAGGVMTTIFGAFGTIAYFQNQIDLAAFCATIVGGLLVFLWFNIPPARFYLGETGMMALVFSLSIIVFMTDKVFVFLVIAFPLVITSISSFIQIISKRILGPTRGKIFRIAPLHHHFEAIGWSRAKITMRYWIISTMCAVMGIILAMIS